MHCAGVWVEDGVANRCRFVSGSRVETRSGRASCRHGAGLGCTGVVLLR